MMCNNCLGHGELIEFNTFSYYYCRECKIELKEDLTAFYQKALEDLRRLINVKVIVISDASGMDTYKEDDGLWCQFMVMSPWGSPTTEVITAYRHNNTWITEETMLQYLNKPKGGMYVD